MNSSLILSATTFVYGLAASLYLATWVFHKKQINNWATWVVVVGIAGNTAGFVLRWVESYQMGIGRIPLSNLYESLVFFSLMIALIYFVIEGKYGHQIIGAFAMPLAFLSMAYASLSPNISDRIQPLLPALKSNWLTVHVVTCFIGCAAFAIGFGLALMYLIKKKMMAMQIQYCPGSLIDGFWMNSTIRWCCSAFCFYQPESYPARYGRIRRGDVTGVGTPKRLGL
jgi:ABC-type transport system involved in cytochrome c biogenesis permease subunit